MTTVILDVLVLLFLLVTIYVCHLLNKRIKSLQDGRSELAEIIAEFDMTTKRATQTIQELHSATERIAENIQHRIDKANFVADDLQFLIERAGKVMHQNDTREEKSASHKKHASFKSEKGRSRAQTELEQLVQRKEGKS